MSGTTILWSCYANSTPDSFNVYRAVTGIAVSFPNSLVAGDQLVFSATSQTIQTVTLGSLVDIGSVAAAINAQAVGITATVSQSGSVLFIRCTAQKNPVFRLMACTFATHTTQTPRSIAPRQEFTQITSTAFVSGTTDYTYADTDGSPLDWYQVTSVASSVESIPSVPMSPLSAPAGLCVLVGRVVDAQNKPLLNARVIVKVGPPVEREGDAAFNYIPPLVVYTDAYGRWSIPIIQMKTILLNIAVIGYNQFVQVPAQNYALFQDLVPVNDELFEQDWNSFYLDPPFGDGD